jgi:hypothetical protein
MTPTAYSMRYDALFDNDLLPLSPRERGLGGEGRVGDAYRISVSLIMLDPPFWNPLKR